MTSTTANARGELTDLRMSALLITPREMLVLRCAGERLGRELLRRHADWCAEDAGLFMLLRQSLCRAVVWSAGARGYPEAWLGEHCVCKLLGDPEEFLLQVLVAELCS